MKKNKFKDDILLNELKKELVQKYKSTNVTLLFYMDREQEVMKINIATMTYLGFGKKVKVFE